MWKDWELFDDFMKYQTTVSDQELILEIQDAGFLIGRNQIPCFSNDPTKNLLDLIKKYPKTWGVVKESVEIIRQFVKDSEIFLTFKQDFVSDPLDGFEIYLENYQGSIDNFTIDLTKEILRTFIDEKNPSSLATISFEIYP